MYERILIPTDGSDEAEAAAQHGVNLAESLDAAIVALHVIDAGVSGLPSQSIKQAEDLPEMEAHGEELCERIIDMADEAGVDSEFAIEKGKPYEEITEFADGNDIDAIVMGTRGRSGIEDYLLGNVTEKVVRTSNVPVVTIRRPKIE